MNLEKTVDIAELAQILRDRASIGRSLVAIAGPPGSGKSSFAERLTDILNGEDPNSAMVVPMDGYHFDDMVLEARGWRHRKGAPKTFDVAGLKTMLGRLKTNLEPEIAVPVFDREIEIARNSARIVPASVTHIIVEGNYLLLESGPWKELAEYFDTTVYLEVPMDILRERLEARWKDLPPEARVQKLEENDLPNAELVRQQSRRSCFVVRNF